MTDFVPLSKIFSWFLCLCYWQHHLPKQLIKKLDLCFDSTFSLLLSFRQLPNGIDSSPPTPSKPNTFSTFLLAVPSFKPFVPLNYCINLQNDHPAPNSNLLIHHQECFQSEVFNIDKSTNSSHPWSSISEVFFPSLLFSRFSLHLWFSVVAIWYA